jgi:endonuclease/exonuclease/phosphatase family metal-dependent hydrolase
MIGESRARCQNCGKGDNQNNFLHLHSPLLEFCVKHKLSQNRDLDQGFNCQIKHFPKIIPKKGIKTDFFCKITGSTVMQNANLRHISYTEADMKKKYADEELRRNFTVRGLACAALLSVLTTGCTVCNLSGEEKNPKKKYDTAAIMTWNMQALFDGVEDGTEYNDYAESAGWTQEKYKGRLNVIASAIGGMEQRPDIIALQEVESARVMADLASALKEQGYGWTHFAAIPGMALGVGILSRFPLTEARSHSVYVDGEIAPRPMLEVQVAAGAPSGAASGGVVSPLALFVCHWKSKLGGGDATESTRRASARIILRRLRELAETAPDMPVIIMGDLNENYNEFYRRSGSAITALLPDDPRAAEFTGLYGFNEKSAQTVGAIRELQQDFIVINKNKPPEARYFPDGVIALYSPWASELEDGSYYYKNDWETIDHFLLSGQLFRSSGWNFDSCQVVNIPPFTSAKGRPMAYNPRTGSGLSDHLPLLLMLRMQNE